MMKTISRFLKKGLIFVLFLIPFSPDLSGQDFDILIRNGQVLDGTGNPAYQADIGIRGDRIVDIGKMPDASAKRIINAKNLYVTPGFIDMHSHADRSLTGDDIEARKAHNLVAQGITTVVMGADGRNALWPIKKEIEAYQKFGIALNVVPMVGHGTVRNQVMGDDYERTATPDEITRMKKLVRQGMEEGAWGLGAAPEYRPGRFSTTGEIIELAKVVAEYDGFYYAHQRSQSQLPRWQIPSIVKGWRLDGIDGMKETIRVGRESGIRVVGTHIKVKGRSSWGHSAMDILLIERARREGVQVFLDQYAYNTFGGSATRMIPLWILAPPGTDRSGGMDDPRWREKDIFKNHRDNLKKNLADPETRRLMTGDIKFLIDLNGGADRLIFMVVPSDTSLYGKTLADVALAQGKTPVETLIDFAKKGTDELPSGALFRPIGGHEFDVENYMRQEYTATCTDAGVAMRKRPGRHPRFYGGFPRKIAVYVKDRGVITLPFAIRSMTSLAAQIIGLPDRGIIRKGYRADLVIYDYERIRDRATILEPHHYPEGIEYVLINGQFTVENGSRTGALSGEVLKRRAFQ